MERAPLASAELAFRREAAEGNRPQRSDKQATPCEKFKVLWDMTAAGGPEAGCPLPVDTGGGAVPPPVFRGGRKSPRQ